ncbi:MAG: ferredoxin III, nif-specific [Synechococcales cyanobacterium C42_A2020_086]|jgi:Nif-specific ferredoxin III|nr:ferredoxin III, nif-specific [Synechococcales cyanobacterium M58_A2018_015]MBF2074190.1 ferredoxin III, nif-specific [Synechococcales cyanobacterium C42_A2020_086]
MTYLTNLTLGKKSWTPHFVESIEQDRCLGCGRCFKACGRDVLLLRAMNDEGEFVDNEEDEEIERKVMAIIHPENCIGCQACARVCPKNCYTHSPMELN